MASSAQVDSTDDALRGKVSRGEVPPGERIVTGVYFETLVFYSLLASAFVVVTDLFAPLFGASTLVTLPLKPALAGLCAYLAARSPYGAPVLSGFFVGAIASVVYQLVIATGFYVERLPLIDDIQAFKGYLMIVVVSCVLAGSFAGGIAAALQGARRS